MRSSANACACTQSLVHAEKISVEREGERVGSAPASNSLTSHACPCSILQREDGRRHRRDGSRKEDSDASHYDCRAHRRCRKAPRIRSYSAPEGAVERPEVKGHFTPVSRTRLGVDKHCAG